LEKRLGFYYLEMSPSSSLWPATYLTDLFCSAVNFFLHLISNILIIPTRVITFEKVEKEFCQDVNLNDTFVIEGQGRLFLKFLIFLEIVMKSIRVTNI